MHDIALDASDRDSGAKLPSPAWMLAILAVLILFALMGGAARAAGGSLVRVARAAAAVVRIQSDPTS